VKLRVAGKTLFNLMFYLFFLVLEVLFLIFVHTFSVQDV